VTDAMVLESLMLVNWPLSVHFCYFCKFWLIVILVQLTFKFLKSDSILKFDHCRWI